MNAAMIRAYNPYINTQNYEKNIASNTTDKLLEKNKVQDKLNIDSKQIDKTTEKYGSFNTDKIISRDERDYFKKLFPESKDLIENHVLFTRSGKTQSIQVAKGIILDNRI